MHCLRCVYLKVINTKSVLHVLYYTFFFTRRYSSYHNYLNLKQTETGFYPETDQNLLTSSVRRSTANTPLNIHKYSKYKEVLKDIRYICCCLCTIVTISVLINVVSSVTDACSVQGRDNCRWKNNLISTKVVLTAIY